MSWIRRDCVYRGGGWVSFSSSFTAVTGSFSPTAKGGSSFSVADEYG